TGPLLAPNGGSNGLDPFYATRAEHQQTLNTGGPMAGGNFGEGSGGSGSGGSMGGFIPTTFTPDSVQHAPPQQAEPPECDCHCGDEEGTHYLDQTSDMVGEVHGDTVTRGSATRSLEDVQEWDDLNPNLTPEGWDEFFALGENAAQHRQDLIDKLTKLRGIYKEVLGDLAQPGLTKSNLKLLDHNRRNAYERIREIELELGILGQTALMTLRDNLVQSQIDADNPLWTGVTTFATHRNTLTAAAARPASARGSNRPGRN
ncbi:MAG: hypothetical protein AB7I48_19390, partial [Planctomycetaceae bacterium]